MSHYSVLRDFYDTIWERGDVHEIHCFFLPDTEAEGLFPDMAVRPEDFQAMVLALLNLVEGMRVEVLKTVSDDEWIAALVRATCVSRETGQPLVLTGQTMLRFQDDKIVEAHNQTDLFGFFTQLGLIPEDALIRLLSGDKAA